MATSVDIAMGGWAAVHTTPPAGARRVVGLDGTTVRSSASDAGDARHLLAAIDHRTAVVLGQVSVERKTNEIPMLPVLCDRIDDLEEAVITADALHAPWPPDDGRGRFVGVSRWGGSLAHDSVIQFGPPQVSTSQ